jgi:ABC-type uncharacterized transport system substrate-binding protein
MRKFLTLTACGIAFFVCLLAVGRCGKQPKRIFFVNSYHEGYPPSDAKMLAIQETVAAQPETVMKIFFMDGLRHPDDSSLETKTAEAVAAIKEFRPDVLIASDDDAVKYVIAPNFRKGPMPVVFCGVNWTCQQYGLPTAFVTGMLEVKPVKETVQALQRYYPRMKNLFVLAGNAMSERKDVKILESQFRELGLFSETVLVNDFDSWKRYFESANASADVLFLPTNGSVSGWNDTEAYEFVYRTIRKPVFTCDEFMMRYAVFGMAQMDHEQGEWAAHAAIEILSGKSPADIPVATNRRTRGFINPVLAAQIEFKPDEAFLETLEKVR